MGDEQFAHAEAVAQVGTARDSPIWVVGAVVEVATAARPSTPISAALCRKAAARKVDLLRFSGEASGQSAANFSNRFGLVKSRAEWRLTGL